MAKEKSTFEDTAEALFEGMSGCLSSKTVVGDPVTVNDTVIIPLCDVQFGVGAGSFEKADRTNGAGGITGKMSPSAVLVIQNGNAHMIHIKNSDSVSKLLDAVPEILNRFTTKSPTEDAEADQAVNEAKEAEETTF